MRGTKSILVPLRLYQRLEETALSKGCLPDELGAELLAKGLEERLNPEELAAHYEAMSERYLEEARDFLEQGEFAQASEKLWGAAASAVKALAVRKGERLEKHGSLWDFVSRLASERGDEELLRLFHVANSMHRNFYEDQIRRKEVLEAAFEDVRRFVAKLREEASRVEKDEGGGESPR